MGGAANPEIDGVTRRSAVLAAGAGGIADGGAHQAAGPASSPGEPAQPPFGLVPEASVRVQLPGAQPGKKHVISYSLFGSKLTYLVGAIKNAQLAERVYPEFTCRFIYGASVPPWVLEILGGFGNVELVDMTGEPECYVSTLWRFLAAGDPDVDVYLCRDTDSRPGARERAAVDEWLASGKKFHVTREHMPGHGIPIIACCWGCRDGVLHDMEELIRDNGPYEDSFGVDQQFLWNVVYPRARESLMAHDEHHQIEPWDFEGRRRYSVPGDGQALYVGQARDENERDRYPDDAPKPPGS
ncbi:MAG: hypothetical protein ACKOWF_03780 [Chloroflexota bacterium]